MDAIHVYPKYPKMIHLSLKIIFATPKHLFVYIGICSSWLYLLICHILEIKRGFGFNAQDLSSIHVMRQTIHIYIYKVKIKGYRAHQDKIDFVKCSK